MTTKMMLVAIVFYGLIFAAIVAVIVWAVKYAPQNRSASPILPFAALISASVIQYGTSAGLQFFRHPRHLLGFTLSPAIT